MQRASSEAPTVSRRASGAARGGRAVLRTLSGNLNADGKLSGAFQGISVAVVQSKAISRMRRGLIEQAVTDLGGTVIPSENVAPLLSCGGTADAVPSDKVTRILVRDVNISDEKVLSLTRVNKLCCPECNKLHVQLVDPDVLDKCAKNKCLPDCCTTPSSEQQNNKLFWGEVPAPAAGENQSTLDEKAKRKRSFSAGGLTDTRSNKNLVEALSRLSERLLYVGEEYRSRAYKRASEAVAKHTGYIRRVDPNRRTVISQDSFGNQRQVTIQGLGKSCLQQMKEVLEEGSSFLLRTLDEHERIPIIKELMLVWGVGQKTAIRLHRNHEINSWQELRSRAIELQNCFPRPEAVSIMLTFLEYFEDLHEKHPQTGEYNLKRIPRDEVEQLGNLVQAEIDAMSGIPLRVHVCGSYRRGKKDTGDIDMVLEPLGDVGYEYRLDTVVEHLADRGIVKHLVKPSNTTFWSNLHRAAKKQGEFGPWSPTKSYMGFIRLSSAHCWRRIDMWMYCDKASLPFGILQYTGSKHFNCSMRLYAKKKNLVLNSTGLYYGKDSRSDGKLIATDRVEGSENITCEEDIFQVLGLKYIEPSEREGGHPTVAWKEAGEAQGSDLSLQEFGEDDSEEEEDAY